MNKAIRYARIAVTAVLVACCFFVGSVLFNQPLFILHGHSDCITCMAMSPDDRFLASGSADHTARIWQLDTCKTHAILGPYSTKVEAIVFSPDGKQVVVAAGVAKNVLGADRFSADGDSKLKIYDMPT